MNWKGYERKWTAPNMRYYPEISPEMLRKTSKNLSQESRSPGRDLNQESPECEAGILPAWLRHLVINIRSPWTNPKSEDGLGLTASGYLCTLFVGESIKCWPQCYIWQHVGLERKKAEEDNIMKFIKQMGDFPLNHQVVLI